MNGDLAVMGRWGLGFTAAMVLLACASPRARGADVTPFSPGTYVYRCEGDYRFVVRVEQDSVRLRRDEGSVTLPQVISASGTRYNADGITFWSKGLEALFETPTESFESCKGEAAETPWAVSRLLGNDFRAVGQEPGWMIEIDQDRRMHVLTDYGVVDFYTPPPELMSSDGGTTVYRARTEVHDVTVTIEDRACQDTMSGEAFPRTVEVVVDGQAYQGCGRALDGTAAPSRG